MPGRGSCTTRAATERPPAVRSHARARITRAALTSASSDHPHARHWNRDWLSRDAASTALRPSMSYWCGAGRFRRASTLTTCRAHVTPLCRRAPAGSPCAPTAAIAKPHRSRAGTCCDSSLRRAKCRCAVGRGVRPHDRPCLAARDLHGRLPRCHRRGPRTSWCGWRRRPSPAPASPASARRRSVSASATTKYTLARLQAARDVHLDRKAEPREEAVRRHGNLRW
jgi:hypothetical protein